MKAKIATATELAGAETKVKIAILMAAIAALVVACFGQVPGAAIISAAAAVGFASYDVAMSWCNNEFAGW